jgi:hypothetical protein
VKDHWSLFIFEEGNTLHFGKMHGFHAQCRTMVYVKRMKQVK